MAWWFQKTGGGGKGAVRPGHLFPTAFFVILALKLASSAALGSHFIRDLTSPFVEWTLRNFGADPWTAFLQMGNLKAFPYHLGMLVSLLPGRLLGFLAPDPGFAVTTWVDLLTLRLPLLAADILIYVGLIRLTQMPVRRALWLYWASPIVFYINYVHGQLDILPVAMLFGSLWLLRRSHVTWAAVLFAASLGTKSTALLLLPVVLAYVFRSRGWEKAVRFGLIALGAAGLLMLPGLWSTGYQVLVLGAEEQFWLFKYSFELPVVNVRVYLSVLALLMVYWKVWASKRINTDLLMAFVGLCMIVVVLLVPPMPGWFMWMIPPLAYLSGIGSGGRWRTLVALNVSFLVWFLLFAPTADLLDCTSTLLSSAPRPGAPFPVPTEGLASYFPGISLTALIASLLYSAWELWTGGIASNEVYRRQSPVVVGIAGDSASGKDTLCGLVRAVLGDRRVLQVDGDDYHRWARSDPRYQRFSHLHVASNRLHEQASDVEKLREGETIQSPRYDHGNGQFTPLERRSPRDYILVSGLHSFLLMKARWQLDARIYLDPDERLREFWKISRDTRQRGYSPQEVKAQMEAREEDSRRFVKPQRDWADLTLRLQLKANSTLEDYQRLGEAALELRIQALDRFDWNAPLAYLGQLNGMQTDVELDDQGTHMDITVAGTVSAETLSGIAQELIPNLHEISCARPAWEPGLRGVMQLFVLTTLSQARRRPDSLVGLPAGPGVPA